MQRRGYDTTGSALDIGSTEPSRRCTAVLGSMTHALQAQRALSGASLHSEVIKISSSKSGQGCTYGVTYACMQDTHVRAVLSRAGIAVRRYTGG